MALQKPPGVPDVYWQDYLRKLAEAGGAPTPTPPPTPAPVSRARTAAIAGMERYIEDPRAAEQAGLAQLGITTAELPAYQELALQINRELGGSYVNGVLTAPTWWTGSITEWSRHVQEVTNTRWHLTTSPVTTPPPPTPPPDTTPPPTPSPTGLFDCPYCGLRFSSTTDLATHLSTAHPTLPGGGGAGEGGTPMTTGYMPPVGTPEWTEETYGPQAGYLAGLGLYGKAYQSPYQQYQAGMYDPLSLLWQMQAPMAMAGMQGYNPTQYLSQFGPQFAQGPFGPDPAQSPFSMYGMASQALRDVMGMTPEQRAGMPGAEYGGGIAQLLGLGLRQQLGPGASWLQGRIPAERTQWMAQYPQQLGPTFLDYIKQKYNLGQWL